MEGPRWERIWGLWALVWPDGVVSMLCTDKPNGEGCVAVWGHIDGW